MKYAKCFSVLHGNHIERPDVERASGSCYDRKGEWEVSFVDWFSRFTIDRASLL